jgi:hypothetical protein
LFAIGLVGMGGPAALVAYLRGRNAVGWFFLGLLLEGVVIGVLPAGLRASTLVMLLALLLAPTLLLLLPNRRRARKHVEPQDWSSAAVVGRDPGREPDAEAARDAGPRDARS